MKAQQLAEHFSNSADQCVALAKTAHSVMAGEEEGSPMHTLCKAVMEYATSHGESCVKCGSAMGATAKAAGMDSDEVMPLPAGFSRVGTAAPVRAVPRFGSPEMSAHSEVDKDFESLVRIEGGE
jgi:hypothetical protein